MVENSWILVVEPGESDRKLIELAANSVAPGIEVAFVAGYDEFVATMAERGSLPALAVLEWFAGGGGPASCLDTLSRLGFLSRLPIVATAREDPVRALNESFEMGIPRFVSKKPDDFCFKKKMSEAMSDCIPGAKRVARSAAA